MTELHKREGELLVGKWELMIGRFDLMEVGLSRISLFDSEVQGALRFLDRSEWNAVGIDHGDFQAGVPE